MNFLMREPSVAAPPSSLRRSGLRGVAAVVSLAAALAGCGQKGPLTLPPASAASAPAAAK